MEIKTKKRLEWTIFSIIGVITLLSLSLFFYQLAYAGKIYPHVNVAGIDLSGKTKQQASALLDKRYQSILNEEVTLKTGNGEVKTKVKDTGLSLDLNSISNDSYRIGRNDNFFIALLESVKTMWQKHEVTVKPKIDQTKYDNFLRIAVAQLNSDPQDASLKIENGTVLSVQEKNGISVDTATLMDKILALASTQTDKVIVLDTLSKIPTVKAADFDSATQFANNILDKKISFVYEDKTYAPTKLELGLWVSFTNVDGKFSGSLNNNNILAYLNKIAKNFEITKKDKKINALDNSVIEEGREGKYLDKNDAIAQVKNQVSTQSTQLTVTMKTYAEAPGETKVFPAEGLVPGRFEGRYIDIDLTLQKLCRVESTNIVDCYPVSSGKPGMATPTGTYTIFDKNPRHWSGTYSMWLPWWEQFKAGGYGIHELPETATWKEVPDHLGTPISHGCVRLGVGPAETVYNWTSIGTPVYIHK